MLRLSFQKVSNKKTGKFGIKYRVVDQSDDLRGKIYYESDNCIIDSLHGPDLDFTYGGCICIHILGSNKEYDQNVDIAWFNSKNVRDTKYMYLVTELMLAGLHKIKRGYNDKITATI